MKSSFVILNLVASLISCSNMKCYCVGFAMHRNQRLRCSSHANNFQLPSGIIWPSDLLVISSGRNGDRHNPVLCNMADLSGNSESNLEINEIPEIEAPAVQNIIKFAIPAIGIWLCGPLLSLIDTSAVGMLSGTAQLAALNPAITITDDGALLVVSEVIVLMK